MRTNYFVLVEQGQLAGHFEDALDNEHHVRAPGVILVEHQGHRVLQRPRKNAFAEFSYLLAVLEDDGVFTDQVDTADMAVQVDADARPVEACGNLLNVGGLTGTVIALHHNAAVVGKARQDRQRGLLVEEIVRVEIRYVVALLFEGGHGEGAIKPEDILHRHGGVGGVGRHHSGIGLGHWADNCSSSTNNGFHERAVARGLCRAEPYKPHNRCGHGHVYMLAPGQLRGAGGEFCFRALGPARADGISASAVVPDRSPGRVTILAGSGLGHMQKTGMIPGILQHMPAAPEGAAL